ncbi:glycosyltransferase [Paenibacillus medicaginis]|uniref:Glycosyltransferase n=1 Tax=Paenibacillus medicaginis TaxID=1470560 RepID=A0ABV5C8U2_9BACL
MLAPLTQPEHEDRIRIGNGCRSGPGLVISISNRMEMADDIEIGPYVSLCDAASLDEVLQIPVPGKPVPSAQSLLRIGERVRIGARATVSGSIHIGRWSVIQPGSVVVSDVPEACRVAGNPAVVTAVYDPATCSWEDVDTPQEAEAALARRKNQPLLSICLPTYNREGHLQACLNSIFSQIGATDLVEVIVSDNCSPDGTHEVAARFMEQYPNMRYVRNPGNIGADRNIVQVAQMARGTFLKLHGDDDYFLPGTLRLLLSTLHNHPDCSLIHTHPAGTDGKVTVGDGMKAYLAAASTHTIAMVQTSMRRKDWMSLENRDHWAYTSLSQIYWQYGMLTQNPKFCILNLNLYWYAGTSPEGYNIGMVGIRNYEEALSQFEGSGLDRADIDAEMSRQLLNSILPIYRMFAQNKMDADFTDFEAYYTACYNHQPYYEQVLQEIRALRAQAM